MNSSHYKLAAKKEEMLLKNISDVRQEDIFPWSAE